MLFRQMIVFAILLIGVANSQSWKIYTIDKNNFKFDNLSIVQNDTLVGIESGDIIEVPVQNILSVRSKNTNVGCGIAGGCIGGLTGGIMGMFMGVAIADNYETGGLIFTVSGTIVGYLISSNSLGARHNLYNMTLEQKVDKINTLIEIYEK